MGRKSVMSRDDVLFRAFLVLIYMVPIHGQSLQGFISIDAGKPEGSRSYTNETTGILYVPDFQYIFSGITTDVSSAYKDSSNYQYSEQDYDLRYFPNGTRNCYMIPVQKDTKYLVRATFLYGDYDGKRTDNLQFELHLGINHWKQIDILREEEVYTHEIIAMATSETMSVCLVNVNKGTPFISSLELRPLNDALYPPVNSSQSLVLFLRINEGGETLRYPNDALDRIWIGDQDTSGGFSTPYPINTSSDNFGTPEDVMRTAISADDYFNEIKFDLKNGTVDTGYPSADYYLILQFAEINEGVTGTFDVELNDVTIYSGFQPEYLKSTTITQEGHLSGDKLNLSLTPTYDSSLSPLLNAYELYIVAPISQSETFMEDVDAITAVKDYYKVQKNWMGDPCLPKDYKWEGLDCKDDGHNSPRITSLKLSSSGLTGEVAPSLAKLTEIQYIDLSNNGLTGSIPDFFATLPNLNYLDLTNNKLTGEIPKDLLDRSNSGSLKLRIDGNQFSSGDDNKNKHKKVITRIVVPLAVVVIVLTAVIIWRCVKSRKPAADNLQQQQPKISATIAPMEISSNPIKNLH